MKVFTFVIILLILLSCQGRQENIPMKPPAVKLPDLDISQQAAEEVLAGASPVEMAVIVKSTGVKFSEKNLYDLGMIVSDLPAGHLAYILGMLSSDLGYLNTFEKTAGYIRYLSELNKLSEAINMNSFFEFGKMKEMAESDKDYENLSFVSLQSFNRMDEHLRQNKRNDISIPILAGVWLEGMYHAVCAAQINKDEILPEVIGEQKSTLNNLMLLLSTHRNDLNFPYLVDNFGEIREVFSGVKVTYVLSEPVSVEQNGILTVVQQESSEVEISPETLSRITEIIKNIRNKPIIL